MYANTIFNHFYENDSHTSLKSKVLVEDMFKNKQNHNLFVLGLLEFTNGDLSFYNRINAKGLF